MKVAFPHMGYFDIAVTRLLQDLNIEVIPTPPITKHTLELGSLYSPEGVCLPYKIIMGNFIESTNLGADTLITACGAGKCRMGFYNCIQKIALEKIKNHDVPLYTVNTDHMGKDLYTFLHTAAPNANLYDITANIYKGTRLLGELDKIHVARNEYGSKWEHPEDCRDIYNLGLKSLAACKTVKEMRKTSQTVVNSFKQYAVNKPSFKVGLIGEFYTLLEPAVNYNIETVLLEQGIEVTKFVYCGDFTWSHLLLMTLGLYSEEKSFLDKAMPYLNYHVGGHGLKSVGSAQWFASHGYDGLVHVYPFGCMPEIVAQYALKNVTRDYQIPLLSLSIDEHSSDVGFNTRIEAFVDCIMRKKQHIQH